jgi:hypothetical protein
METLILMCYLAVGSIVIGGLASMAGVGDDDE